MRLHCRGHLPPRPSSLVPPPSPFYRHAAWSCWPGSPRGSLFSCFVLACLGARAQVGPSGPQTAAVLAAFVCGCFLFCPTSSPACSARPASGVVKYNALPQSNPLTGAGRQSARRPFASAIRQTPSPACREPIGARLASWTVSRGSRSPSLAPPQWSLHRFGDMPGRAPRSLAAVMFSSSPR